MSLEQFLANITLEELEELKRLKELEQNRVPIYSFSKIRDADLDNLFDIEKILDDSIFDSWFNNNLVVNSSIIEFFKTLIDENRLLISDYSEEDLKVNIIIPIINLVKFKSFEDEFREFYELPLRYESNNFILSGTTAFVISKGLVKSKKPYFFIQEFKRAEEYSNSRPQLLAEMISAVELNRETTIKGAYIIGENWNFVILNRVSKHKYQYYVSRTFNSTNIEDLKSIYKNLLFVKNEIIQKIRNGD